MKGVSGGDLFETAAAVGVVDVVESSEREALTLVAAAAADDDETITIETLLSPLVSAGACFVAALVVLVLVVALLSALFSFFL